jgi:hypothetical protein
MGRCLKTHRWVDAQRSPAAAFEEPQGDERPKGAARSANHDACGRARPARRVRSPDQAIPFGSALPLRSRQGVALGRDPGVGEGHEGILRAGVPIFPQKGRRVCCRHPLSRSAAPTHVDGLRHQPFKILLAREAAIRGGRNRPEILRGRLTYRHGRGRPWEKRARCGIAVPDVGDGQDAGGDGAFSPPA